MKPAMLFFDVGETLVSEERMWVSWAQWLGVPPGTFFAALGAVIQRRGDHREVYDMFRPDFDLVTERDARSRMGIPNGFLPSDLYPDTISALRWAAEEGYRLGFAGNHSRETELFLKEIGIKAEIVGSSERWGVSKPDPRFFRTIVDQSGLAPEEIAYIGDRLDNDVLPARAIGMHGIFVVRGPWGIVQAQWPEASTVTRRIGTLADLRPLLDAWC